MVIGMKFSSHLNQATLLKRTLKFLTEAITPNRQKIMVRCPNLALPHSCDILGSKIWYSNADGQNCLPTWEIVEVDGGHLVCINPDMVKPLVVEAIGKGIITELSNFTVSYANSANEQYQTRNLWLEDNSGGICFVGLEQIMHGDDNGDGRFTTTLAASNTNLSNAISIKQEGHRAVIFYCVMHTGVVSVKYAPDISAEYVKLLHAAVKVGVEIYAYKINISYQEMQIISQLPVSLPVEIMLNQRTVK